MSYDKKLAELEKEYARVSEKINFERLTELHNYSILEINNFIEVNLRQLAQLKFLKRSAVLIQDKSSIISVDTITAIDSAELVRLKLAKKTKEGIC